MSANRGQIEGHTLDQIKEQMEDFLTAINQNTDEIQANYSMISELMMRLEKLRDNVERITLYLGLDGCDFRQRKIEPLTNHEQMIFIVLYTAENFVSYSDISRRTGLPETLVSHCITNLVEKGIPLFRRFVNNTTCLKLDPVFREVQAKENIVKIQQLTDYMAVH